MFHRAGLRAIRGFNQTTLFPMLTRLWDHSPLYSFSNCHLHQKAPHCCAVLFSSGNKFPPFQMKGKLPDLPKLLPAGRETAAVLPFKSRVSPVRGFLPSAASDSFFLISLILSILPPSRTAAIYCIIHPIYELSENHPPFRERGLSRSHAASASPLAHTHFAEGTLLAGLASRHSCPARGNSRVI